MKKYEPGRFLLSFIIVAALVIVPADKVKAANTISGNAGTLVTDNVTVTYDGKVHYPKIEFTPIEGGVDYTLFYYVPDDTSKKLSAEYLSLSLQYYSATEKEKEKYQKEMNDKQQEYIDYVKTIAQNSLPGYKEVGTYKVDVLLISNGMTSASSTLTITSGGSTGENTGGNTGGSGTGTGTGEDASGSVDYVKKEFSTAINKYDSLGADKVYSIDIARYKIKTDSQEFSDMINFFAEETFSDYNDEEGDIFNFRWPHMFFLRNVDYKLDKDGYIRTIDVKFETNIGTQAEIIKKYEKITEKERNILLNRTEFPSSGDYILAVHDGMCRELDFAYKEYKEGKGGDNALHTADGVLENSKGLCDGYAYVFKYFMDRSGIPCRVVCSNTLNHCWNMVKVQGIWFHVDVAFDDLVTTQAEFTSTFSNAADQLTMYGERNADDNDIGYVNHAYFLKNDAQMKALGYKDWEACYPSDTEDHLEHPPIGTNTTKVLQGVVPDKLGAFSLIGNTWYSADASGTSKEIDKWSSLSRKESVKVTMPVAVRYLTTDGKYLYYVSGNSVYRSMPDGSKTWQYTPEAGGNTANAITEFAYRSGKLEMEMSVWKSSPSLVLSFYTVSQVNSEDIWRPLDGTGGGTATPPDPQETIPPDLKEPSPSSKPQGTAAPSPAEDGTDAPALAGDNTGDENFPEEGDEVTIRNMVYEITETEDAHTVTYKGMRKKGKTAIIPGNVKIDGVLYKVTAIADDAFAKDSSLKSVKIGANVQTIGEGAFKKAKSLKSIVIPSGVSVIGKNAFYQCSALKDVQFKGTKVPSISKNSFKGIFKKAVIRVPKKSLNAYKKKLTSKIGITKKMKIK